MNELEPPRSRTDPASVALRARAKTEGVDTIWDRYAALGTQCKVGELGICCTVCHLGPCNLGLPGSKRPQVGVCGATIDTVAARRLARDMAAGSAAHSDHGRSVANLLLQAARGEAPGYRIADEPKLMALADELGVERDGKPVEKVAEEVAAVVSSSSASRRTSSPLSAAHPRSSRTTGVGWGSPRAASTARVVEVMHRTHHGRRRRLQEPDPGTACAAALADGWGGSMIATDLQDVLFGTPAARSGRR